MKEQVKEIDIEFEARHVQVLDFIKEDDKDALDSEEAQFDVHVNRVADIRSAGAIGRPDKRH